jgi:hypothetical protein
MRLKLLAAALVIPLAAYGGEVCSVKASQAAAEATDKMNTWPAIYSGFKSFRACDDGGVSEGFTEAVVHLLASDWKSVNGAASISKRNDAFREFLLEHIDATADTDELKQIASFSESKCPQGLSTFCKAIHRSANAAIQESAQ